MTWALAAWSWWGRLSGQTKWIAFAVVVGLAVVVWQRWDAGNDALRDAESKADKARIEHLRGAKETEREIEDLDDDDFGSAIDGLPRSDDAD